METSLVFFVFLVFFSRYDNPHLNSYVAFGGPGME